MSIKNILTPSDIPIDLARTLGPQGIRKLLELMWLAYTDLKKENVIVPSLDENEITQEWFIRLLERWSKENNAMRVRLWPIQQHSDATLAAARGQKPTIDFCFRTWQTDDGYFGAECKKLKQDDKAKFDRYVETGVEQFISGRYGSKSTASAMVGYVMDGTTTIIIPEIEKRINHLKPVKNLLRDMTWDDPHYNSIHIRVLDKEQITLHHLFFTFAS